MTKLPLLLLSILFLSSCSLAPFSPSNSGRSYGQGKLQAEVGNVNNTYHIKFGAGITKDLDAGFDMEFGAISTSALFFKYSFLNNEVGPSVAMEFGYGSTETTKFYYGGLIASLAFTKQFELFVNPRVASVSTDETEIEKDTFHGNLKLLAHDITYLQATYGMNIWFNDVAGLSLYSVYFKGNDIETSSDSAFGASFLFNM